MRRKIFSTLLMILGCVAIIALTMMVSPAYATSVENPEVTESPEITATPEVLPESTETPEESTAAPTEDGSSTETEAPSTSETPEASETPSEMPETPAETPSAVPTQTPTPTLAPVVTPKPTPAPTTPPKLGILTPPALSAEIEVATPSGSQQPGETDETAASTDSVEMLTPTHQVEHVEQIELDPGFRLSDFIGILCYIVYGLAGFVLLLGIVRIAILLIFKKDILPSKKERQKAKEEKERQEAIQRQPTIQTDVTEDEYNIHKDDWNWK